MYILKKEKKLDHNQLHSSVFTPRMSQASFNILDTKQRTIKTSDSPVKILTMGTNRFDPYSLATSDDEDRYDQTYNISSIIDGINGNVC